VVKEQMDDAEASADVDEFAFVTSGRVAPEFVSPLGVS